MEQRCGQDTRPAAALQLSQDVAQRDLCCAAVDCWSSADSRYWIVRSRITVATLLRVTVSTSMATFQHAPEQHWSRGMRAADLTLSMQASPHRIHYAHVPDNHGRRGGEAANAVAATNRGHAYCRAHTEPSARCASCTAFQPRTSCHSEALTKV